MVGKNSLILRTNNDETAHSSERFSYAQRRRNMNKREKDFDERIEKQNRQIAQWIWTVFVSVMASLVTALLYTR